MGILWPAEAVGSKYAVGNKFEGSASLKKPSRPNQNTVCSFCQIWRVGIAEIYGFEYQYQFDVATSEGSGMEPPWIMRDNLYFFKQSTIIIWNSLVHHNAH